MDHEPAGDRGVVDGLLTALAYARGDGVDDGLWLRFAAALGTPAGPTDLERLRSGPAASLLESFLRSGTRVTRLADTNLAHALLAHRPDRPTDESKLLDLVLPPSPYLWWEYGTDYAKTHAAEYAATAGRLPELLQVWRYVAVADLDRLLPLLPSRAEGGLAATVAVLRTAAARALDLPPARRAALFALATHQLNLHESPLRLAATGYVRIRWAQVRGDAHQVLAGHRGVINSVAVGRAGDRDVIVSGGDDMTVRMWDAASGQAIGTPLTSPGAAVGAVTLGRVGDRDVIVSGETHGPLITLRDNPLLPCNLQVWDAVTGEPVGPPMVGHEGPVTGIAVGRAGDRDIIVSASADRTVRIWDAATGQPIGAPLAGHTAEVTAAALGRAGDRDIIASASSDSTVRIWDAATGLPAGAPLTGHTRSVTALAAGQSGTRDIIVSAGIDKSVRIWDPTTGQPIGAPLTGHTNVVESVALGRVGGRDVIVSASVDATMRLWDPTSGQSIGVLRTGETSRVLAVAMGRGGDRDIIVTGGNDSTVRIWDPPAGPAARPTLTGHSGRVTAVALGRVGERDIIASGSVDGTVRLWDAAIGLGIGNPLPGTTRSVSAVAFGRIGYRDVVVATSADDIRTTWVWDASTRESVHTPLTSSFADKVMMGRVDGREVMIRWTSNLGRSTVNVQDTTTGKRLSTKMEGHNGALTAVALGQAGGRDVIVTCGSDYTVRAWHAASGRPFGPLMTGRDLVLHSVSAVAVGRAGSRDIIVTGGHDKTVRAWDAATGEPVGIPMKGHTGRITAVHVQRLGDRDIIISGSDDTTVRVWDAVTHDELFVQDTFDPITSLACAGDLLVFATGAAICAATIGAINPTG